MKPNEKVHFKPDSVNLLNLVFKYKIALLIVCVAAAIVSAIISVTITPLFKSVVVLYPTTNVVLTQNLFSNQNAPSEIFGNEGATEKVLQILRSDNIKNYLVRKYDLTKHYKIEENAKYKYTQLNNRMNKYIISRKTQYNSIEISVLDTDPVIAATMANDIANQLDTVFNKIVQDAEKKTYKAIRIAYEDQLKRVRSLEDSLNILIPKGTLSIYQGNTSPGAISNSWKAASIPFSPLFLRLNHMFESENENLSVIKGKLSAASILSEQNLPYTYVINEAKVAERKAVPKRSLIVFASTVSALLLMLFILGLADSVVKDGQ
jgi:uncharacterized protein involved in exopolysaccharide biosynthesis